MKITDNLNHRLSKLLDDCKKPDRLAEINNLLCVTEEARRSLRVAIELHRRVSDLEDNPDSAGKHDLL